MRRDAEIGSLAEGAVRLLATEWEVVKRTARGGLEGGDISLIGEKVRAKERGR